MRRGHGSRSRGYTEGNWMTEKSKQALRFGLPKGSLQESTLALMAKAGWRVSSTSRSYIPRTDDAELEIRLIRAQEISLYVEHGFLDAGLTGADWIAENVSDYQVVCVIGYSKQTMNAVRCVYSVLNDGARKSVKDLD